VVSWAWPSSTGHRSTTGPVLDHLPGRRATQGFQRRGTASRRARKLEQPLHRLEGQRAGGAGGMSTTAVPTSLRNQDAHLQLVKPESHEAKAGGRLLAPAANPARMALSGLSSS